MFERLNGYLGCTGALLNVWEAEWFSGCTGTLLNVWEAECLPGMYWNIVECLGG